MRRTHSCQPHLFFGYQIFYFRPMRKTDKKKLAEITSLIASWKESGLSQRIFCERSMGHMKKYGESCTLAKKL